MEYFDAEQTRLIYDGDESFISAEMSLVELGWRQFTFFEKRSVMDPTNSKEKFKGLEVRQSICSVGIYVLIFCICLRDLLIFFLEKEEIEYLYDLI